MQQNLQNPSFWRRRYVRFSIAFIMTCSVVGLALMIKLVIFSKNTKYDASELLISPTTPDHNSNRSTTQAATILHSTMIASTVEDTKSYITTKSSANQWIIDSYLISERAKFAAVVLENGEVLVSGGFGLIPLGNGDLSSTEIYSPMDRKWRAVADMQMERVLHTLTVLQNQKRILAIGCFNLVDSYVGEIYDIELNRWTYISSIMDAGRFSHTATLMKNGQVLIVGGRNIKTGFQSSVELYDPVSNTFLKTGSLNAPRSDHTATLLGDGMWVIVTGGKNSLTYSTSTAEVYVTGSWYYTPGAMTVARYSHAAVLLLDGNVLVAGGLDMNDKRLSSVEIYHATTYNFSLTKSMACERSELTLTLLPSGQVLAAGGVHSETDECSVVSELYDPITGEWTSTRLLNTVHYGHATVLLNDSVLLIGGYKNTTMKVNQCERYDL